MTHLYPGVATAALADIDVTIGPGLTALTGPSGGGKSTLLRLLNGLVPHFHGGTISGAVDIAGHDLFTTPTRRLARHVGFVFQDPELQFVGGVVEREVAFGPANLGRSRAEIAGRVESALEAVGAGDLRHRRVSTLSGGEQQRVAIAGALAMASEVLALDEPISQLDASGARDVMRVCRDLAAAGTAVVVAEHRLDDLLPAASSLAVLEAGRLVGWGAPERLAGRLAAPPQVVELGRLRGWRPLPLDLDAVRRRLGRVIRLPTTVHPRLGGGVWWMRAAALGLGAQPWLEDVDVAGCSGEIVAVMGPNGGGKSTFLRGLAGLLPPRSGSIERRPGRVAYLPQNPAALLHQPTVRGEVELTLRRGGAEGGPEAILNVLGLGPLAGRHPRDLSAGERQRTAIAAILCGAPAIALLDEPTRGMDALSRAALVVLIQQLAAGGGAVVLATHDSTLAAEVAHRVLEVSHRSVRDLGPPRVALSGDSPYATQLGRLLPQGPVTVAEAATQV